MAGLLDTHRQRAAREAILQSRARKAVTVIGRLKPGATPQQATEDLNAIASQLAKEYPKTDRGLSVRLIRPGLFGDDGEGIRGFLFGVTVLALLLLAAVSANLASPFAARTADRGRELAVRVALGSSRLRLVGQLLTEALVVSLVAGGRAAGRTPLLAALDRWQPPFGYGAQRLALSVDVDPRVYLAGLALTVVSALLFGMVRRGARGRQSAADDQERTGATHRARLPLRDVLLAAQIAICTLLVTASLVAVRGMTRALDGPTGSGRRARCWSPWTSPRGSAS